MDNPWSPASLITDTSSDLRDISRVTHLYPQELDPTHQKGPDHQYPYSPTPARLGLLTDIGIPSITKYTNLHNCTPSSILTNSQLSSEHHGSSLHANSSVLANSEQPSTTNHILFSQAPSNSHDGIHDLPSSGGFKTETGSKFPSPSVEPLSNGLQLKGLDNRPKTAYAAAHYLVTPHSYHPSKTVGSSLVTPSMVVRANNPHENDPGQHSEPHAHHDIKHLSTIMMASGSGAAVSTITRGKEGRVIAQDEQRVPATFNQPSPPSSAESLFHTMAHDSNVQQSTHHAPHSMSQGKAVVSPSPSPTQESTQLQTRRVSGAHQTHQKPTPGEHHRYNSSHDHQQPSPVEDVKPAHPSQAPATPSDQLQSSTQLQDISPSLLSTAGYNTTQGHGISATSQSYFPTEEQVSATTSTDSQQENDPIAHPPNGKRIRTKYTFNSEVIRGQPLLIPSKNPGIKPIQERQQHHKQQPGQQEQSNNSETVESDKSSHPDLYHSIVASPQPHPYSHAQPLHERQDGQHSASSTVRAPSMTLTPMNPQFRDALYRDGSKSLQPNLQQQHHFSLPITSPGALPFAGDTHRMGYDAYQAQTISQTPNYQSMSPHITNFSSSSLVNLQGGHHDHDHDHDSKPSILFNRQSPDSSQYDYSIPLLQSTSYMDQSGDYPQGRLGRASKQSTNGESMNSSSTATMTTMELINASAGIASSEQGMVGSHDNNHQGAAIFIGFPSQSTGLETHSISPGDEQLHHHHMQTSPGQYGTHHHKLRDDSPQYTKKTQQQYLPHSLTPQNHAMSHNTSGKGKTTQMYDRADYDDNTHHYIDQHNLASSYASQHQAGKRRRSEDAETMSRRPPRRTAMKSPRFNQDVHSNDDGHSPHDNLYSTTTPLSHDSQPPSGKGKRLTPSPRRRNTRNSTKQLYEPLRTSPRLRGTYNASTYGNRDDSTVTSDHQSPPLQKERRGGLLGQKADTHDPTSMPMLLQDTYDHPNHNTNTSAASHTSLVSNSTNTSMFHSITAAPSTHLPTSHHGSRDAITDSKTQSLPARTRRGGLLGSDNANTPSEYLPTPPQLMYNARTPINQHYDANHLSLTTPQQGHKGADKKGVGSRRNSSSSHLSTTLDPVEGQDITDENSSLDMDLLTEASLDLSKYDEVIRDDDGNVVKLRLGRTYMSLEGAINRELGRYVCTICDKAFSQRGGLHIHMRIHYNIKPYKCEYCDLSFSQLCNKTRHVKSHFNLKPYACDICGKTFNRKYTMRKHRETQHLQKNKDK